MIDAAVAAARRSPCAKSQRGAVVYDPRTETQRGPLLLGRGWNGQPEPFVCAQSEECRASCAKLCVHAEARAIRAALGSDFAERHALATTHLLHAKVIGGALVPGGGPSCWQCSRDVLDNDLGGVWLYENVAPGCDDMFGFMGVWKFYTALDFHRATLNACGLAVREAAS
jgi:hypothetical protein